MNSSTIVVTPELKEWRTIRRWVESFCVRHGVPRDICLKLQLAAEEWFVNVVTHGFARKENGHLTNGQPIDSQPNDEQPPEPLVRLSIAMERHEEIVLELIDNGPAYNPLERKDPDISLPVEERPIGGLGVYLIKRIMDHCEYRRQDGCNRLTLRKRTDGGTGKQTKE
jgi:anti-sigma regulatory factor (Ser/Thr protein kinase)